MIVLKEYQHSAVNELLKQLRALLLGNSGNKTCVLKAPTGSGKTIMMAELLQRLADEDLPNKYVFVWASLYDLHSQSKAKLAAYLSDTRYNLMTLDDITDNPLPEDAVLFTNWESLTKTKAKGDTNAREWANTRVKPREDGRTVVDVLDKTREVGRQVVLIVDEAHRNFYGPQSQRFVHEIIKPRLTIEVSATPETPEPPYSQVKNHEAGWVEVPFADVVASGLIKQETVINQSVGEYINIATSANELVVKAALAKRAELARQYEQNGIQVNPLLLVQLPSETEKTSALDVSVREEVEQILAAEGITYENGKLAIWLSDPKDKINLSLIEKPQAEAEVLIFKEAVAVGWDCPRAQVLAMLRAIRSLTFEIQTVGRILRMPEAKHYDIAGLNKAYVYSNIADIHVSSKPEDMDFFKTHFAYKKPGIADIELPSVYLHRQDYEDLTVSFTGLLVEALSERFGIEQTDMVTIAYRKADEGLELDNEELQSPILSDVVVHNLDAVQDEVGTLDIETIQTDVSAANIQREFDYLMKAWSLPYVPARSFTKIKAGLYKWFERIGINDLGQVQRILACSEQNQIAFAETIETAKIAYEKIKPAEIAGKRTTTRSTFTLPDADQFGDNYEDVPAEHYALAPCYLRKDRSGPERYFENWLERNNSVDWWYKNGESKQQYFAVSYQTVDEETKLAKLANFYPDYIVRYKDGTVGIYDTKAGRTVTERPTYDKSNALQAYIVSENGKGAKLAGGILNKRDDGLYIYTGAEYTSELDKWQRL